MRKFFILAVLCCCSAGGFAAVLSVEALTKDTAKYYNAQVCVRGPLLNASVSEDKGVTLVQVGTAEKSLNVRHKHDNVFTYTKNKNVIICGILNKTGLIGGKTLSNLLDASSFVYESTKP